MRKHFLLLFLMALLPLAGWAVDPTTYNGANTVLRFKAIVSGTGEDQVRTAEIIGFVNGGDVANLTIPATVNFAIEDGAEPLVFKVVKVNANAFKDNETLTSVTFSANLTEIEKAFTGCKNLTTVNFTAAVDLTAIAEKAFEGTAITALDLSTTKVVTINNLLGTQYSATPAEVVNNNTLTTVKLPKTVTSIAEKAFENCTALATVEFAAEDNAENQTIGAGAFKGTAIQTLDLSKTTIAAILNMFGTGYTPAFANTVLKTVKLPKTVTSIAEKAFENCTALATVEFAAEDNAASQTIGAGAFKGTAIQTLDLSKTTIATINNLFGTQYAATAFANTVLTTVKLPKTVTSIAEKAFENCTALATVTFEAADAAATIGAAAFKGTAIQHLDLSKTKVATIENFFGTLYAAQAVANNTLTTVTLPVTWTSIKTKAFENCVALATINLYPGTGTSATTQAIETLAFNGTALTALDFANTNVKDIPVKLLMDGSNVKKNTTLTSVTLTNKFVASETGLNNSFAKCEGLTTVNGLQNTAIVKLSESEFEGDIALATINTSKIQNFGDKAFKGCTALESIKLDAATSLGENAFEEAGLTSVEFPKTLTTISKRSFYSCEDLATVTFKHGTTDDFTKIDELAFGYTAIETITIPVKISDTESAIAQMAFGGCEKLKSFIMKPTAATIEKAIVNAKAFLGCTNVVFYTTEAYVTANAEAPANSTYSVAAPATTDFTTVKFANENKYYVKWYSTDKGIKIKKGDAKVYDAYLDADWNTLDMVLYKTKGGYYYIPKDHVALIITDNKDLTFEESDNATISTSWVTGTQVLQITTEAKERLELESAAVDEGKSLYAWANSATKGTGFLKITSGKTIPANTIYVFAKEEPAAAAELRVVWLDEDGNIESEQSTTAIEDIIDAPVVKDGVMYNMQGVRVDNPSQKGIYIQNGKKYVVK